MDIKCKGTSNVTLIMVPPIIHSGFNRNDGVAVYVHESMQYQVVCTKTNLPDKIIKATNKNNQRFVVACIYIFPSLKRF